MKKGFVFLFLILSLLFSLGLAESAGEDPILATAYDGSLSVSLSEVQSDYDDMLSYYIYMYSMYGMDLDEYDQEFQAEVANSVVENAIDIKVVFKWAEENGYVLDDERTAAIEAAAQASLEEARESYREYLTMYGLSGDDLEQAIEEQLEAGGYSLEAVMESEKLTDVLNFITETASKDITVTEEEAKESFAANIASQKETYSEDPDSYISDVLSGAEVLYTPEGVRNVKVIFINLDGTEQTEETETEGDAESSEEAASTEAETEPKAEAEAAETAETAASDDPDALTGEAKANAILKAISDGTMTFDDAMITYNEDTSTVEEMQAGYPIAEGSAFYSDEFVEAAMALKAIGDISPVVVTDYGYFLLMYDHDVEAGEADFEAYAEAETASVLEEKTQEAYTALISSILEEAGIVVNDLSPLYHVYEGEPMATYSGFALTKEAVHLTDKPAGETVANLESGTALELLGTISVDDTEYAFVSVIGTEFKGYLPVSACDSTDETIASGVDNSDKAVAVSVEGALPIFTIVMQDGSLIYGELYPEIAPETVANFIDLANTQKLYDGLIFHRVIPGFVIQGGDPDGNGTGGPGYSIKGEFTANGVENDLSHTRGVLSMARSQDNDSAGSQFFLMHADSTSLDGSYAAFGLTLGGLETIDVIASVPTDSNDKPREDQVMRTVYVETHGETYTFTKLTD